MSDPLAFLAGGGEAARMIRARDWSDHPLGPPQDWTPEFRAALSLVLNSPESMILAWGLDLHFFFNDTYFPLLGPRLSWAMGARFDRVWADGWDQAKPIIDEAMAGRARRFVDLPWKLDTDRGAAQTWWTFSYSRVLDAGGAPAGLFIFTNETTARVRADAALGESEDHYRHTVELNPQVPWTCDPNGNITSYSNRWLELTGQAPGEPLGQGWSKALHPDDLAHTFAAFQASLGSGEPVDVDYRLRVVASESGYRWMRARAYPRRDKSGAIVAWYGIVEDIHDRKLTEAALRESEARYRRLFESMDEGFCVIEFLDGPDGPASDYVHVEANPAYARHAGIPNVVGQRVRAMVPAEAQGWVDLYGAVLRNGAPLRFERMLEATGRHLEVAAFRVEPASRRQVAVLFQDITARKHAETALRQVNESLEARVFDALSERNILADIVEGTNAFVQVVDLDFRIMAINGAAAREFEQLFGVLPKVGDAMLDLLANQPEHRQAVRAVWSRALAGEEFVEVAAFGDPARRRRHYELRFSCLRNAEGRQIGAYQFVYDVTERLREQERLQAVEDALRQAQKMEAVGQLTGGLAHDFNNLLAGISGSLELMQTRMQQGRINDVDRYMAAAQGAAKRAAALTHRLLAFSRRQTLDPRPTDVNALVGGMEELIRRTVGPAIAIEVVGASGLWATLVDPPQLENALLNLCINARDAMPTGGRITIETANRWLDHPAARQHDVPEGQYLSLCVSDTGTGMAPDVIAKAFDPFFTTKPIGQGTGLGLSMIYGFTKQSGGQVRIYSEVGQGTTVCIYLPRYHGALGQADALVTPLDRPRAQQGETVLVVDDEPTVRMLVTEVLEELGYTAIEAADSVAGLQILQSDVRIDLLVTDVGLPGGMNGRQMADAGRVRRPDLKILFVTGYAENAAVGNGYLEPGMQVLTKPFAVDTLAARIRELVNA